ncbi:Abi-alpha family protein [Acetobacterium malicum]|uniref:Abi-alpha family protein n=1 Tax=Acetobacterium malicum TaxID=52692 RepID=UPI00040D988C|nr:Abi-alpha family protein [Acetobacterium dehalogenans]
MDPQVIIEFSTEALKAGNNVMDIAKETGIYELAKSWVGTWKTDVDARRKKNLINMLESTIKEFEDKGLPYKIIPIELRVSVSILEEASLEDDEFMRKLWANLFANATYENSKSNVDIACVDVLRRLSLQDAEILLTIYKQPFENFNDNVITKELPSGVRISNGGKEELKFDLSENIEFSLSNLERLGCINGMQRMGPSRDYHLISRTILGKKVYESCTLDF